MKTIVLIALLGISLVTFGQKTYPVVGRVVDSTVSRYIGIMGVPDSSCAHDYRIKVENTNLKIKQLGDNRYLYTPYWLVLTCRFCKLEQGYVIEEYYHY